jgi:hypothetical protein
MDPRKLVQILSPLRAANGRSMARHMAFAEQLCHLAAVEGRVAPFAPHLLYTRFLDDAIEAERQIGLDCGAIFLARVDEVWVWDLWGISTGMRAEIAFVEDLNDAALDARSHGRGPERRVIAIRYASVGEIPCWDSLREVI